MNCPICDQEMDMQCSDCNIWYQDNGYWFPVSLGVGLTNESSVMGNFVRLSEEEAKRYRKIKAFW
jgi:hypothetical protein